MNLSRVVFSIVIAMSIVAAAGCSANAGQPSSAVKVSGERNADGIDPTIPAVVITGKRMGRLEKLVSALMDSNDH